MKHVILGLIQLYRKLLSPIFPPSCIYEPSCSEYALVAVGRFGAMKGTWLAILRIMRCHPFRKGGFDPVPDRWENRK